MRRKLKSRYIYCILFAYGVVTLATMYLSTFKLLWNRDVAITQEDFAGSPGQLIANQETKIADLFSKSSEQEGMIAEMNTKIEALAAMLESEKKDVKGMENLCKAGSPPSLSCHHVVVLPQQKVSFCASAKVASTTIRDYFFKIAEGGVVIPDGAIYGVHEANWTRLAHLDPRTRKELLMSAEWTHVFFWKPVLDRFVSGYLDKVVNDCKKLNFMNNSRLAIKHYDQYGFSCEKHQDLESFVSFMEGVTATRMEGHFAPQTTLCDVEKFPYTDFIVANQTLSANLKVLSKKLGVEHPEGSQHTSSHKTGATNKMVSLFEGKQELIGRILKLFEEDCKQIPEACDVKNAKDELP